MTVTKRGRDDWAYILIAFFSEVPGSDGNASIEGWEKSYMSYKGATWLMRILQPQGQR